MNGKKVYLHLITEHDRFRAYATCRGTWELQTIHGKWLVDHAPLAVVGDLLWWNSLLDPESDQLSGVVRGATKPDNIIQKIVDFALMPLGLKLEWL